MRTSYALALLATAALACRETPLSTTPSTIRPDLAASAPSYELVDLGTLGGDESQATSLNDSDWVAGWSTTADGTRHAFLWKDGTLTDLGTLGGCCSRADAVNNTGQVAGKSVTVAGEWHAFLWTAGQMQDLGAVSTLHFGTPTDFVHLNDAGEVAWDGPVGGIATHAMLWSDGSVQDLGTLGGASSQVAAITPRGDVAGNSDATGGSQHAFSWNANRGMQDLGSIGAVMETWGANARGQLVGIAIQTPSSPSYHTWLWDGTQLLDLGTMPFCCTGAINDPGQVAAETFFWDKGAATPLPLLPVALNNAGTVVGIRNVAQEVDHAFVWVSGQLVDLGAGNPQDQASSIPSAINATGDVVGWFGAEGPDPEPRHAALWRVVGP
jgi:probable HAF family extracellular repeat protein